MLNNSFSWVYTLASVAIGYFIFKQMKGGAMGGMKGGGGGGGGGGQDIFNMGEWIDVQVSFTANIRWILKGSRT